MATLSAPRLNTESGYALLSLCYGRTTNLTNSGQNPFRSKLAAAVIGGIDNIFIAPGKKVLYLGAASGTSVSHGRSHY